MLIREPIRDFSDVSILKVGKCSVEEPHVSANMAVGETDAMQLCRSFKQASSEHRLHMRMGRTIILVGLLAAVPTPRAPPAAKNLSRLLEQRG